MNNQLAQTYIDSIVTKAKTMTTDNTDLHYSIILFLSHHIVSLKDGTLKDLLTKELETRCDTYTGDPELSPNKPLPRIVAEALYE